MEKKKNIIALSLGLISGLALMAVSYGYFFSEEETPTTTETFTPETVLQVEISEVEEEISEVEEEIVEEVEEEVDIEALLETAEDLETYELWQAFKEQVESGEIVLDSPTSESESMETVEDMYTVERKQLYVAQAVASSVFPTWRDITYGAENTLDGNTDTAWVENADGIGIGEWVEHHFGSVQSVEEIQFYNGYGSAYEQNGVCSQVSISLSGGEHFIYDVNGHWNTLILPSAFESEWVRITILKAYSSQDQDTCISEILIFNKSEGVATTHTQYSQ